MYLSSRSKFDAFLVSLFCTTIFIPLNNYTIKFKWQSIFKFLGRPSIYDYGGGAGRGGGGAHTQKFKIRTLPDIRFCPIFFKFNSFRILLGLLVFYYCEFRTIHVIFLNSWLYFVYGDFLFTIMAPTYTQIHKNTHTRWLRPRLVSNINTII